MTITAGCHLPTPTPSRTRTRTRRAAPAEEFVTRIVVDAVVAVLEIDPGVLLPDTRLDIELGADSLALVEIIEMVEAGTQARLGEWFTIADRDLPGLVSVGALTRYVAARARG